MTVSVIIPTRDRARYLKPCLESLSRQTFRDLEVWVVDDASRDDTASVFRRYARPRWHYLRNPEPLGPGRSRRKAIARAAGGYIAFLDSDDIWVPGKIQRQLETFADPKVVLCHTARFLLDEAGARTRPPRARAKARFMAGLRRDGFRESWSHRYDMPFPCTSSVVVRASALAGVDSIDGRFRYMWDDVDLWYKLLRKFKPRSFAFIDEPLVGYRFHSGQISTLFHFRGSAARADERRRNTMLDRVCFLQKWGFSPDWEPPRGPAGRWAGAR